MLVGFGFKANSGKGTCADLLVKHYEFKPVSFADAIKRASMKMFGFTEEQTFTQEGKKTVDPFWGITPVQAFQWVGTECFRETFGDLMVDAGIWSEEGAQDFWIKALQKRLESRLLTENFVLEDVRFPNEAKWIKNMGGVLIRVDRKDQNELDIGRDREHLSETSLEGYEGWDFVIHNDSTIENMKKQLTKIMANET